MYYIKWGYIMLEGRGCIIGGGINNIYFKEGIYYVRRGCNILSGDIIMLEGMYYRGRDK